MTRVVSTLLTFIVAFSIAAPISAQPPPCFDFAPLVFDESSTPQPAQPPTENSQGALPACEGVEPLSTSPLEPVGFKSQCEPKGWVTISFRISEDGDVSEARLRGLSVNQGNHGWAVAFAERASESMRQWRYPHRDHACEAAQEFRFETTEEGETATRSEISQ